MASAALAQRLEEFWRSVGAAENEPGPGYFEMTHEQRVDRSYRLYRITIEALTAVLPAERPHIADISDLHEHLEYRWAMYQKELELWRQEQQNQVGDPFAP